MKIQKEIKNIGLLNQEQRLYNLNPPYQRESGVWSDEKKQLFLDSLINGYDIPKLYVHDYNQEVDEEGHHYAIIDGKQRMTSIWSFVKNEFPLNSQFEFSQDSLLTSTINEDSFPKAGDYYRDFKEEYKENFKNITMDIVKIFTIEPEDIDEQFSRLNNGEPLNSAEKRNAFGGDMALLVREISNNKFFKEKLHVKNNRYSHYEISVKFLRLEWMELTEKQDLVDLTKKYLDAFVIDNKNLDTEKQNLLKNSINKNLIYMCNVFQDKDFLLSKVTYPQLYYIFIKRIKKQYASLDNNLSKLIHDFLERFEKERVLNTRTGRENDDLQLYTLFAMQGTNSSNSMKTRLDILEEYFIKYNCDNITTLDPKRLFTYIEREFIWITNDKQCQKCKKEINLDEMDADHIKKWKDGGKTVLNNARCLCFSCNRSDNV